MDSIFEDIRILFSESIYPAIATGVLLGIIWMKYFPKIKYLVISFIYNLKRINKDKDILKKDLGSESLELSSLRKTPAKQAVYLKEIELVNIRCFSKLKINFGSGKNTHSSISLLGDNSLGKSTLLKSIALSLCNESDAVSLIKSMEGKLIKNGKIKGSIKAKLIDSQTNRVYTVEKEITQTSDGDEQVRELYPIPHDLVFVCAYGTQRTRTAQISYEEYFPGDAVKSLFNDSGVLQNPEVVLLRADPKVRAIIKRKLADILLLDNLAEGITTSKRGLRFNGPWGSVPFTSLSDGYRSTTQWVLDLFSWILLSERIPASDEPAGIILIDEIEQHLHPRWQRFILQRIKKQFPRMQLIITTHTPLVVSGGSDLESNLIVRLIRDDQNISHEIINPELLQGKRADQVLTSLFDLVTSKSPKSSSNVQRYSELSSKKELASGEKEELILLKNQLNEAMSFGENDLERNVETAVSQTLDQMLKNPSKEIDLEVKKQLLDLFKKND